MEKSLNSSSESTVSGNSGATAFNKPTDFYQAFEVSMEESIRNSQSNKSDLVLDTTSSGANKAPIFRKSRKSIQHSFNVSSGESLVNNETEQSVTITKPQGLFTKQNKSLVDFFNVSFNETVTGENKTNEAPENDIASVNSEMNDTTNVTVFETKTDPFKHKKSVNECTMMSLTEQRSTVSAESFGLLSEPNQVSNISFNKSTSKMTNNTSYLEQSSINDDNLNNWMSDQSDEEIPPPRIPSLNANMSGTKEKQAISNSPEKETDPMLVWEEKMNEIITNATKKSNALKLKAIFDSPKKGNSIKKQAKVVDENSTCANENIEIKYKPPKLLKPASFVSKQLYAFIKKKLEPKYGIDTVVESENLVSLICDTVKKVTRRKTYQKRLIQNLKKEMAKAGLIETTMDFYEFIIKFLPYSFRVKVVPCLQPVTNLVYPPKDIVNPFDKVL